MNVTGQAFRLLCIASICNSVISICNTVAIAVLTLKVATS